jgi:hypothetical protein
LFDIESFDVQLFSVRSFDVQSFDAKSVNPLRSQKNYFPRLDSDRLFCDTDPATKEDADPQNWAFVSTLLSISDLPFVHAGLLAKKSDNDSRNIWQKMVAVTPAH